VASVGIAAACAAAVIVRVPLRIERRAAWLAVAALASMVLSALLSPRPYVALDAVRTMAVFAAVPVLCASVPDARRYVENGFVLRRARQRGVVAGAVERPLAAVPLCAERRGRETSALIGNTGLLGLVLAFAA
jgi:hypothetical protein